MAIFGAVSKWGFSKNNLDLLNFFNKNSESEISAVRLKYGDCIFHDIMTPYYYLNENGTSHRMKWY